MPAVIDSNAIHAVFSRLLTDGSFEAPVGDYLRGIYARRPFLLLAFAPKCAGTYFRQAAIHAIGGQLVRMCHAQGGRDGTFYLPNVVVSCLDRHCAGDRDAPSHAGRLPPTGVSSTPLV